MTLLYALQSSSHSHSYPLFIRCFLLRPSQNKINSVYSTQLPLLTLTNIVYHLSQYHILPFLTISPILYQIITSFYYIFLTLFTFQRNYVSILMVPKLHMSSHSIYLLLNTGISLFTLRLFQM